MAEKGASRSDRLEAFLQRLAAAPAAASLDEARALLESTLDAVEDELTDIPKNPSRSDSDGRLYAPQEDARRAVGSHPGVVRFRSRAHNTFFSQSGAIEIRAAVDGTGVDHAQGKLLLSKPDSSGKDVWGRQT